MPFRMDWKFGAKPFSFHKAWEFNMIVFSIVSWYVVAVLLPDSDMNLLLWGIAGAFFFFGGKPIAWRLLPQRVRDITPCDDAEGAAGNGTVRSHGQLIRALFTRSHS